MRLSRPEDADAKLPTKWGTFRIRAYQDDAGREHCAIYAGNVAGTSILCRVHSECLTGDALGSLRCDCGPQLDAALEQISAVGTGILVYLRQEGRDIGLVEKIRAYNLQDEGKDTVEANIALGHEVDARSYEFAKEILDDLGVASVNLLTNNPTKSKGLAASGVLVAEITPLVAGLGPENKHYIATKSSRMGHKFPR